MTVFTASVQTFVYNDIVITHEVNILCHRLRFIPSNSASVFVSAMSFRPYVGTQETFTFEMSLIVLNASTGSR